MDGELQGVASPERFTWRRLVTALLVLTGALLAALAVAGYAGAVTAGRAGVFAAGVAFLLCWVPNVIALALLGLMRRADESVVAVLAGMLLRMAPPLFAGVVLLQSRHWLVDAGILPMLLGMYLASLVVETGLSLWVVGALGRRTEVAAKQGAK